MTLLEAYFSLFAQAFGTVLGLFFDLLEAAGAIPVFIGVFTILCVVRFLVAPLVGESGSSKAGDD